jgi:hypothetical protein
VDVCGTYLKEIFMLPKSTASKKHGNSGYICSICSRLESCAAILVHTATMLADSNLYRSDASSSRECVGEVTIADIAISHSKARKLSSCSFQRLLLSVYNGYRWPASDSPWLSITSRMETSGRTIKE